jgi:hypothetical protein
MRERGRGFKGASKVRFAVLTHGLDTPGSPKAGHFYFVLPSCITSPIASCTRAVS